MERCNSGQNFNIDRRIPAIDGRFQSGSAAEMEFYSRTDECAGLRKSELVAQNPGSKGGGPRTKVNISHPFIRHAHPAKALWSMVDQPEYDKFKASPKKLVSRVRRNRFFGVCRSMGRLKSS